MLKKLIEMNRLVVRWPTIVRSEPGRTSGVGSSPIQADSFFTLLYFTFYIFKIDSQKIASYISDIEKIVIAHISQDFLRKTSDCFAEKVFHLPAKN